MVIKDVEIKDVDMKEIKVNTFKNLKNIDAKLKKIKKDLSKESGVVKKKKEPLVPATGDPQFK